MGKTITIEDDAYQLLVSLKQGPGDSFTKVIRRHVYSPAKTNAELLHWHEKQPPPDVDQDILEQIFKQRGRRSGGRK